MPLHQDPTGDTSNNQNARCDCEQCALFADFMGFSEFRKVAIAGAARTEMIEPLFSLVEWHRSRRDSLQNVRPGTPGTSGIWKLPDQTTAKCVQESLVLACGISSCVQTSLLLQRHNIKSKRCRRIFSNHRSQIFSFQQSDNTLPQLFQIIFEFLPRLFLGNP